MCGIIGIIGHSPVTPLLLNALKRLEYRGYDSAGIATLVDQQIECRRAKGKLSALEEAVAASPLKGTIGIGHTRWATHGIPSVTNAHPHATAKVAVVHNGIIENFQSLRKELEQEGIRFQTETDTEVIPHLLDSFLSKGKAPQEAMKATLQKLEGAFAICALFAGYDNLLLAARKGSPLAIGYGEGEMYLGSDAFALAPFTSRISYLEEGDWAELSREGVIIYDKSGQKVAREIKLSSLSGAAIGKGNYRHFMLKEIHEQPSAIGDTLNAYYNALTHQIELPSLPFTLTDIPAITIIACGTSYYAGLTAKYWLESLARIPVTVDIASEFRYRNPVLPEKGLALCISQSGETADTLAALHYAKTQGQYVVSLVNNDESSMAHQSHAFLRTLAGPEIGVASTKAFTTQLVVLAAFALAVAKAKNRLSQEEASGLLTALIETPGRAAVLLNHNDRLQLLAKELSEAKDILYIGRGTSYPIALEGALKLKELSYIHAEGIPAGELKHGPIALVDENVPVIVVAPSDQWFEKTASNVQEVAARGGKVIVFSDKKGIAALQHVAASTIEVPEAHAFVSPILYVIPVQLLAYHVAVHKGTDVDQPRNLAKSVTVE